MARNAGVSLYCADRQVVCHSSDAYVIIGDPDAEKTGFMMRVAMKLVRAS